MLIFQCILGVPDSSDGAAKAGTGGPLRLGLSDPQTADGRMPLARGWGEAADPPVTCIVRPELAKFMVHTPCERTRQVKVLLPSRLSM